MNGWFTEGKRTKNSLIRLTELSNAAIAALDTPLVQKAKVGICRWGQLLMGEEIHQIDEWVISVIRHSEPGICC